MKYNYFDLNYELVRMENIFNGSNKFSLLKKAINNLKNKKNVSLMTSTLNSLNKIFRLLKEDLIKDTGNNEFFNLGFDIYLSCLDRYKVFLGNVSEEFAHEYKIDFQNKIFEHWNEDTIESGELAQRDFIDVFDELHENCIVKYPNVFVKRFGDLTNLYRAQRGKHFDDYNRMIPKEEFVKGNNRWNPPGVAYLYLGYQDEVVKYNESINTIEKTCFEELRLKRGEDVTTCKFQPINKHAKIINFCYEDTDLIVEQDKVIQEISQSKTNEILNDKKILNKVVNEKGKLDEKKLRNVINTPFLKDSFTEEAEMYIGRSFMKSVDEAVFKPVDEKEDPELQVYKPFHYLAEYLRSKGYSGILFRSTRMNLIGLKGKNLVLFDKNDTSYVNGSMNVYYYEEEKHLILNNRDSVISSMNYCKEGVKND